MLVRAADRTSPALTPLGIGEVDYVLGDVTDSAAVERGMEGCDAVLHAASIYSFDVRTAREMQRVNLTGTETVLKAAEKSHLDPVVYVSTFLALWSPEGTTVDEQSPLRDPRGPYFKSKVEAERIARRYQEGGLPVVISYPSTVNGPQDPHVGESAQIVASLLKRLLPAVPRGALSIVDVRDVAGAHAAAFERGLGPRRYVLSGTSVRFSSMVEMLEEVTGRRIPHVTVPAWTLWPIVRAAGLLQRVLPFRLPLSAEGFDAVTWDARGDNSRARAELGFAPRDPSETFADTVEWMYRAGRISAKQAGKLAARAR